MNRGTAASEALTLSRTGGKVVCDGKARPDTRLSAHTSTLFEVTQVASKMFGLVQLEWVSAETRLHLLDFSQIAKLPAEVLLSGRTISPGFAIGLPMVVGHTQELESISIAANISLTDEIPEGSKLGASMEKLITRIRKDKNPKIVVAPRPYAALAALIPYADGFIFEKASVLCHLAILLRENGVPAVASEDLFNLVKEGEHVEVNAK
jgi:phosphohistidine swiveling domain-containing protein